MCVCEGWLDDVSFISVLHFLTFILNDERLLAVRNAQALLRVMTEGRRFRGRKASTAEEMFRAIDADGGGEILCQLTRRWAWAINVVSE